MAVCSEIHTKQINTVCGQNVELLDVEPRCSQTKLACVIAFSIQMHNFFDLLKRTEAKEHFLSLFQQLRILPFLCGYETSSP
jgi:hypothetical protein